MAACIARRLSEVDLSGRSRGPTLFEVLSAQLALTASQC